MFFLANRCKASFYNKSNYTFWIKKDAVDIIFKVKRGVYLTVSVSALSDNRLLLSCAWDDFFNMFRQLPNKKSVLHRLKSCPNCFKLLSGALIFKIASLTAEQTDCHIIYEIPNKGTGHLFDCMTDYVVEAAIKLMKYNLDLFVEIENRCPLESWKVKLKEMLK